MQFHRSVVYALSSMQLHSAVLRVNVNPGKIEKLLEKEAGGALEEKMPLLTTREGRQRLSCLHPKKMPHRSQALLSEADPQPHTMWMSRVCLGTRVQIISSCF